MPDDGTSAGSVAGRRMLRHLPSIVAFTLVMLRGEALIAPGSAGWAPLPPAAFADDDDDDGGGGGGDDDGDDNSGSGGSGGDDDGGNGGGDDHGGDDNSGSGDDTGDDGDDEDDDEDDDGGGDDSRADDDDRRGRRGRDDRSRGRGNQREGVFEWWDRVVTGASVNGSSGRDTVGDEILVVDPSPAEVQRALTEGFTLIERRQLGALGMAITRLGLPPGLSAEAAASRFRTTAPAATVDVNHAYELQGETCSGDYCWGPRMIGWQASTGRCGSGLRIGMVDTAVNASQPALRNSKVRSRSFVEGSPAASPHGTAIAALLVGSGSGPSGGLLPRAELLAADVFASDGRGRPRAGALQIATALDWLAGERAGIVNISIAGPPNAVLEVAVQRTTARGIPIIAAAGNNGADAGPAYPAAYAGVLAATAVDSSGSIYAKANRGGYVAFAAPGVDLWTVGPGGAVRGSGTSYAAAFLTAVAAQNIPDGGTTAARLAAALSVDARDLGAPGKDPVFGWGLVRARGGCRD